MFSNFKREISSKEDQSGIPQDRLKAILPQNLSTVGLSYQRVENGAVLMPTKQGEKMNFTFRGTTYDSIIQQIIDQNPELEHVREEIVPTNIGKVLTRTRTMVTFNSDDIVYINNEKGKISDLYVAKRGCTAEGKVIIQANLPQEIKPFDFSFGGQHIKLALRAVTMHTADLLTLGLYESSPENVLQISLKIPDDRSREIALTFHINLAKAKNVAELVGLSPLLNNVIEGTNLKIDDISINSRTSSFPHLKPIQTSLKEYAKLLEIENYYGVSFGVDKNFVDSDITKIDAIFDTVIHDNNYTEIEGSRLTWEVSGTKIKDEDVGKLVNVAIPVKNEELTILGVSLGMLNSIKFLYQFKVESISDGRAKLKWNKNSSVLIKFFKKEEKIEDFGEVSNKMLQFKAKP